jgi:hypothetical protein
LAIFRAFLGAKAVNTPTCIPKETVSESALLLRLLHSFSYYLPILPRFEKPHKA